MVVSYNNPRTLLLDDFYIKWFSYCPCRERHTFGHNSAIDQNWQAMANGQDEQVLFSQYFSRLNPGVCQKHLRCVQPNTLGHGSNFCGRLTGKGCDSKSSAGNVDPR